MILATTGNFKTYERGTRYQTTQAMFGAGMYYTETPVPEGSAKILVNYDVSMDGASIKPRRGLQIKKRATCSDDAAYNATVSPQLFASKVCYHNDEAYLQLIARHNENTVAVYTIPLTNQSDIITYKAGATAPYVTLRAPSVDYKIHGLSLGAYDRHGTKMQQHVGCFINDQYFCFNTTAHKLYYTEFDEAQERYEFHALEAQDTTEAQAQQMGFNMLLQNPYAYTDTRVDGADVDTISFNSINAFDDEACTTPAQQELILNQKYYYRVSYAGKGTLKLVFDWTPAAQINWQELATETFTIPESGALPKIVVPFSSPAEKAIVRCTAYRDEAPVDVVWFSFTYQQSMTSAVKAITNFSLDTATTMTYWQHRLVVAGVAEDKSYLFMSAPELFEYFPFPNNTDYLDEPIIAVEAFLENLLVFTKSKLYLYTLDPLTGLTRKCIQTNLNIKEEETHLIKIVKNMAYFKSGNYYYMIVPKLNSATGELTIAPIYRNIKDLFDNFEEAMYDIIHEVYGTTERYGFAGVYNYLDYESVHNVYMLTVTEGLYINFDLLYNTVKRTWSIYVYQSSAPIQVYKPDATQPGELCCVTMSKKEVFTTAGGLKTCYRPVVQLIERGADCVDYTLESVVEHDARNSKPHTIHQYNNVQFLDSGAVDIASNYKKRFREIQFRVHNISAETLNFATTFSIDGVMHSPSFVYTPVIDNVTGTLTLTKTADRAVTKLKGRTKLGSWQLSKDAFPGADVLKVRIPVSGKGYNSQIKISCDDQNDYALLDVSSVYRQLYSR